MKNKHKSGFSLLEATIVLSIVGVALGGVWAVISSVQEAIKAHQLVELYIQTAQNVRNYYASRPLPAANATLVSTQQTGAFIPAILPEAMCNEACRAATPGTGQIAYLQMPYGAVKRDTGGLPPRVFSAGFSAAPPVAATYQRPAVFIEDSSLAASVTHFTASGCLRVINELHTRWQEIGLAYIYLVSVPSGAWGQSYAGYQAPPALLQSTQGDTLRTLCRSLPTAPLKYIQVYFFLRMDH